MCQADDKAEPGDSLPAELYRCEPEAWVMAYPRWLRFVIGYMSMTLFALAFLAFPLITLLAILCYLLGATEWSVSLLLLMGLSWALPPHEWKAFRKIGQFWYELLEFHSNLSPADRERYIHCDDKIQYILGMHPHGIIPFQGVLYASYCDQYFTSRTRSLYGFGAGANVVLYLPFLRNIMVTPKILE